ncbi:MAG: beta-lactamase family protein, partial [Planctomycetes bacterium]|nr:beta-lactamase family protein [Planctomycetota bacterium]
RRVGLERPITIHHLLTHTSGFDYDYVHTAAGEGLTLEQYLPRQCQRPLRLQPGRQWLYGASTDILGRLIEVVSGMPLDAFFQERIFAPLGMTDTAFWVPPAKADRLVEMVTHDGAGGLAPGEPLHRGSIFEKPAFLSGGGGLVSTTSDYLRFSLMLLNGGALDGVRLLAPKTVELMRADHLPAGQPPLDHNRRGFGLGVSVLRRLGETQQVGSVGEFGWGGAACTQVWIDPAERMVTLMMSQLRPTGIVGIFTIMDLVKQAAYQAILD